MFVIRDSLWLFVKGRAGRGVEVEDSYMHGEGRQGRGGGGIYLFGDGPVVGAAVEEGSFFRHFFGSVGRTFM